MEFDDDMDLQVTDLKALQVESVNSVVSVPLDGRCRVSSGNAVQHHGVSLDGRRVRRTNLELGLHCNRRQQQYVRSHCTLLAGIV